MWKMRKESIISSWEKNSSPSPCYWLFLFPAKLENCTSYCPRQGHQFWRVSVSCSANGICTLQALESACQCRRYRRRGSLPGVEDAPEEEWRIQSSLLVWKSPWQSSSAGYTSRDWKSGPNWGLGSHSFSEVTCSGERQRWRLLKKIHDYLLRFPKLHHFSRFLIYTCCNVLSCFWLFCNSIRL